MNRIQFLSSFIAILHFHITSANIKRLTFRVKDIEEQISELKVDLQLSVEILQEQINNATNGRLQAASDENGLNEIISSLHFEGFDKLSSEIERLKSDVEQCKRLRKAFQTEKKLRKQLQEEMSVVRDTMTLLETRLNEMENMTTENKIDTERVLNDHFDETMNLIDTMNTSIQDVMRQGPLTVDTAGISGLVAERTVALETAVCSLHPQCSQWSLWSTCSASCGTGAQSRDRICNADPVAFCAGDSTETTETRRCWSTSGCCPSSYESVRGQYCFQSYHVTKNVFEITSQCEAQGDHLVSINSAEKQDAFVNYASQIFKGTWSVAIEGRKVAGRWVDRHGDPLHYENWAEGGPQSSGRCIYMNLPKGDWYAVRCKQDIFTYFCERD